MTVYIYIYGTGSEFFVYCYCFLVCAILCLKCLKVLLLITSNGRIFIGITCLCCVCEREIR